MRVLAQIIVFGLQTADQRPVDSPRPLLVIIEGLVQLNQYRIQDIAWNVFHTGVPRLQRIVSGLR
jgi:hypothetical protein